MDLKTAMAALQKAGTAQNRKVYARHGAREPMFGVSYAALYALQKQIKVDHALAQRLWDSGNHDARVLATLIADPEAADRRLLEAWLREGNDRFLSFSFCSFATKCPAARKLAAKWIDSSQEWTICAGWTVIGGQATDASVPDDQILAWIDRIVHTVHQAPNMARYMMNNALIALSERPSCYDAALAAAERIGVVDVDHGETECKTPLASAYIEKMAARRQARAATTAKQAAAKTAKKAAKMPAKEPAKEPAKSAPRKPVKSAARRVRTA